MNPNSLEGESFIPSVPSAVIKPSNWSDHSRFQLSLLMVGSCIFGAVLATVAICQFNLNEADQGIKSRTVRALGHSSSNDDLISSLSLDLCNKKNQKLLQKVESLRASCKTKETEFQEDKNELHARIQEKKDRLAEQNSQLASLKGQLDEKNFTLQSITSELNSCEVSRKAVKDELTSQRDLLTEELSRTNKSLIDEQKAFIRLLTKFGFKRHGPAQEPYLEEAKSPTTWKIFGGFAYRLFALGLNFVESEVMCNAYGGHLASYHTAAEEAFFLSLIVDPHPHAWIGLYRAAPDRVWKWTDGTAVDALKWRAGEPNDQPASGVIGTVLTRDQQNLFDCYTECAAVFVCKRAL